jgi:signal transduction histidine kinase
LDLYQLGTFFLLTALYLLLEQKRGWMYWGLLAVIIIGIFQNAWGYPSHWWVSVFLISNVVNIEMVRTAFKALKLKKRGAWIIAAGAINFTIFWIAFIMEVIFNYLYRYISLRLTIGDLTFNVAILSIPVATSIYLGLDFAFTNRALQQKLTEVEKLSKENMEMEMKRQAAQIEAMVVTQEQERKRISRDLHDDVGTKLSALSLLLSSLDDKANYTNNHEIRSLAQSSRQFIKETMHDVRQLLLNLSPTVLEEFGYTTAVEGLVNKINETKQIHFDLVVFGIKHRLEKDYELALYRITQELINNVLKHAEAKHVSLQIGQRDEKIILMMEDDGKGFDVSAHKEGYGLNNLDARTKLMQGNMIIDSQPGKGTSVLIEIPYHFNEV